MNWSKIQEEAMAGDNNHLLATMNEYFEVEQFINKFVDKEEGFNSVLLNKLQGIYDDLKWSFPSLNAYVNKFFSF